MGTIGIGFSMSLDGFIAGANDNPENPLGDGGSALFAWMFQGNQDLNLTMGDREMDLKVSETGAEQFEEVINATGAIISGRRMFDLAGAWGGKHPMGVPVVVLTHAIPEAWANKEGSSFTFVTDGIESAIRAAREIAGDKNIGVGGADVARQCLKLGLLDEIHIDLVPVLLGDGVRLFEKLGIEPVQLEITSVKPDTGVTHITYRIIK